MSHSKPASDDTIPGEQINYIRAHARQLRLLPAPGQEWQWADIDDALADDALYGGDEVAEADRTAVYAAVRGALNRGIIRSVRIENGGGYRRVYRTAPAAYQAIQECWADRQTDGACPDCGYDGFRNDPDTDGVECNRCGTAYDPTEVCR